MSTTTSHVPIRSRSRRRRFLIWIPLALVVLVLGLHWGGERSRQAAIDRIAIDNQPLLPAYMPVPRRDGALDPDEWLTRVARFKPAWEMSDLSTKERYAELLDAARAGRFGDEARAAFESFHSLFRAALESSGNDAGVVETKRQAFWVELAQHLRDCDGTTDWGACPDAAVRLLALGLADGVRLAREAERYGSIDPVKVASRLEAAHAGFPTIPFLELARVGDAVHVAAVHAAQAGRHGEALDALRAGLAVARVLQPPHWLFLHIAWSLQMLRVLDGLQTILPMLPRGLDLTDIEKALTEARPRDSLAAAIRGERAFGNRFVEALREGVVLTGGEDIVHASPLQRVRGFVFGGFEQAALLDAMTEEALRAEKSAYLRPADPASKGPSFLRGLSERIQPDLGPSLDTNDRLEARLVLARVALLAYQKGAQDVLKLLPETYDPFDGRPIRCATSEGGLVVFWSAGPDRRDAGADSQSDDIVWRLMLKESSVDGPR